MPITLEIIRASEFIRMDATEHLDFEASKNVLEALALACRKRGLDRAMLDLRAIPIPIKPQFTAMQLAELVGAFRDAGFSRRNRLAVLFRKDVHGGVRTFALLSKLRGLQVEGFDDFERALQWLSEGVTEEHRGVPVPVVKRETKKRPEVSNDGTHGAVRTQRFHGITRGS